MKCSENHTPISIDLAKMRQNGYVSAFKIEVKQRIALVVDSVQRIYPPERKTRVVETVEPQDLA